MRSSAQFGHPLAQGRDDDLPADDDRRRQGQPQVGVLSHQQHQSNRHHQLIGDRIEEGTERGTLLPATRQVTVQPVSDRCASEYGAGSPVTP
ncbi:hypothetical protein D9M68_916730 [compost metagenome]